MVTVLYYINYILDKYIKREQRNLFLEKVITWYYQVVPGRSIVSRKRNRQLIVSLTTIPSRIDTVWVTIESLLRQKCLPDRIILWIAENEFKEVRFPARLLAQTGRGLEIRRCENLRSYKKFYYTMLENPDSYVVTVDDDVIYAESMLEEMVKTYKKNPGCVICNRSHMIRVHHGQISLYRKWKIFEDRSREERKQKPSYSNFFVGCGGTLFPVFLLDRRLFQKEVFMDIAPTGDDIWLNFICWVSQVKVKSTEGILGHIIFMEEKSKKGLLLQNVGKRKNDTQIKAVLEYLQIKVDDYVN